MHSTSIVYAFVLGLTAVSAFPAAQVSDVVDTDATALDALEFITVDGPVADDPTAVNVIFDDSDDVPDDGFFNSTTSDDLLIETRADKKLKIDYVRNPPSKEDCPATVNGPKHNYPQITYTNGQLKAALVKSAELQAKKKQVGANKYPHKFNNNEKLEFECGKNKMEFPIQTNKKVYDGGKTDDVPDRVIYEYSQKKDQLKIKFCGVIRHGPKDFLHCKK